MGSVVACLLLSILSIPFTNLLIFLLCVLHRFASCRFLPLARSNNATGTLFRTTRRRQPSLDRAAAAAEEEECAICLSAIEEGEEVSELRCRHAFHRRCLEPWVARRRATCPLCRDVLAATVQSDEEESESESEKEMVMMLFAYTHCWMLALLSRVVDVVAGLCEDWVCFYS